MQRVRSAAGIPVAKTIALATAAAEYLAEREKLWTPGAERGTGWYAAVEGMFRHQIVPYFRPDRIVSCMTRQEVAKFRIEQIGRPCRTGRKMWHVGPATVNRTMAALAAFRTWCEERQYVIANSACPNPLTKHKPLDEPELAVVDPPEEQVTVFLNALGSRWIAASVVLADTGVRKSELERLEVRNLNLDDGKATVTNTKNRKKARTVFLTPRPSRLCAACPSVRTDSCSDDLVTSVERFGRQPRRSGSRRFASTISGTSSRLGSSGPARISGRSWPQAAGQPSGWSSATRTSAKTGYARRRPGSRQRSNPSVRQPHPPRHRRDPWRTLRGQSDRRRKKRAAGVLPTARFFLLTWWTRPGSNW